MSSTTLNSDSVPSATSHAAQHPSLNWLQRMSRRRLQNWLRELQGGTIRLHNDANEGPLTGDRDQELSATWYVHDPAFYSHLATGGSLGLAESYLQGHWHTEDLTTLLQILCRNLQHMPAGTSGIAKLTRWLERSVFWWNSNTRRGSRRHIAAHYDLSNQFFELFLDPTLMYSSACFEQPEMSLHEASVAKLDRICRKLDLRPEHNVLEIGTGWGGFCLHAAEKYGCQLTTTTISDAQLARARECVTAAGLTDQVQLLSTDYRDLTGQYDRIVSIEMIEAVGERFLDDYFEQCGRLLKPGGRLVLQAIVMPEARYGTYRRSVDFIQRYIFPGGFLPSVAAMQNSVGRTSCMRLESVDDISNHYARTLLEWRRRFQDRLPEVRELGFDRRFIRMWEYYLCYCEAAFREQAVRVVQIAWDKPMHPA